MYSIIVWNLNCYNQLETAKQFRTIARTASRHSFLLQTERLAVGALLLGRINFMGADLNLVQRAVVFGTAMVGTLGYAASDTLVCLITVHHLK